MIFLHGKEQNKKFTTTYFRALEEPTFYISTSYIHIDVLSFSAKLSKCIKIMELYIIIYWINSTTYVFKFYFSEQIAPLSQT